MSWNLRQLYFPWCQNKYKYKCWSYQFSEFDGVWVCCKASLEMFCRWSFFLTKENALKQFFILLGISGCGTSSLSSRRSSHFHRGGGGGSQLQPLSKPWTSAQAPRAPPKPCRSLSQKPWSRSVSQPQSWSQADSSHQHSYAHGFNRYMEFHLQTLDSEFQGTKFIQS